MPKFAFQQQPKELVPDDLSLLGRITALAAAGGILGTVVLRLAEPSRIESDVGLAVGVVLAFAVGVASLLLPWGRLSRSWVAMPVVAGAGLTALACWNTGGSSSPFALFYLYVATLAAYFASRRQTLFACVVVALCASLPVFYDHDASLTQRLFEWVLVTAMSTALSLVLQHPRAKVRRATVHAQALALQDPLTTVANRRGFEQRAAAELARARRHRLSFTILYLDLDGFKRVNDLAGHAAGDELLRRVALAIGVAVRGEDFVARHGGDEFAVLLPGTAEVEARRVAGRIVAAVERTAADDPRLAGLSASVGYASYPADGDMLAQLIEHADRELLQTKAERAFDRDRASRDFAIPEQAVVPEADVFAGLDAPAEESRPEYGWRLRSGLGLATAVGAAIVAAWFLVPLTGHGTLGRQVLIAGSTALIIPATLAAARRARGRERIGWILVTSVSTIGWIPFSGLPVGLGFGLAILLIGALPSHSDRRTLIDILDLFVLVSTFTAIYLVPEVIEIVGHGDKPALQAAGSPVILTLGMTCALLVVTRCSFRVRPDMWLVAVGFGAGALLALPAMVGHNDEGLPVMGWKVVFALAALTVAAGAFLRARNHSVTLPDGRDGRWERGVMIGNLLVAGLLISLVLTRGSIPAEVLPFLLVTLVLRHVRARMIEGENERLEELAHRSERDLAAQYRASLVALGTALEARDGYTGSHGEETVNLSRRVAERLGLSEPAIAEVEAVALLHDVGKIGMPDAILRKRGRLTKAEWAVMREHPLIGERILRQVPGLDRVAKAVRHEHERWDGEGYPDRLGGEAIPLASRITLVCDAYHAMTSDRPYRRAMSHEEAASELRRCGGTQFDPAVVRALLEAIHSDGPARAEPARSPNGRRRTRSHQAAS